MKNIAQNIFKTALFVGILATTACEDVIDINLDEAATQYVITGNIHNQLGPYTVKITQSVAFDEPNVYPEVSNATVIINDGQTVDSLREIAPGVYETTKIVQGVPGRTYQLEVYIGEKRFTAVSTMPPAVEMDQITAQTSTFAGNTSMQIVPKFADPLGLGNYYQFIQYVNNERWPNIFVLDDRNNDGGTFTRPLFAPNSDREIKKGDTVSVDMRCIDRITYKYLYTLDASSGEGPNGTTPSNPDNNFGGAALGYFSAHTLSRLTIVVP